jgi:primosomal protein N' (replication factor Y)
VVVDTPLTRVFHYRVPEELSSRLAPGDRVQVPFAHRRVHGVVVSLTPEPPIDPAKIKPILSASPEAERIPPDILELTRWIGNYYRCSWGTALAAATPAGIKHDKHLVRRRHVRLLIDPGEAEEQAGKLASRAPQQAATLRTLLAVLSEEEAPGGLLHLDHPRLDGVVNPAALRALSARGWLALGDTEGLPPAETSFPEVEKTITLNPEQAAALERLLSALDQGVFAPFLLHGVTGSGKTEIYLRLISRALAQGKSALVLVPEISLTPQTVSRFRNRLGDLAVLHSRLSDSGRAAEWRRLRSGEVRLAVGARSALFAPLENLGIIVVDEEHERSYKQETAPRYHARDTALVRARLAGAVALLGSATPSLESWHNVKLGKLELLSLTSRAGPATPPRVEVIDLRQEWADVKKPTLFSRDLERHLGQCLEKHEQAIIFLNRRGFHTQIRCGSCGDVLFCAQCDIAMTHHRQAGKIRCGYCGEEKDVPELCPACGSPALKFGGSGTERVEDVLQRIFPRARTLRMDSDTMTNRDSHSQALAAFAGGAYDILLGTQMIAKGLDFPNVTLVGVLMADAALGRSDFRAAEHTFQLVTQVIGRAGRAAKAGLAVVQAFQPGHPAIRFAVEHDYAAFVAAETQDRARHSYPPFGRLARIIVSGRERRQVEERAKQLGQAARKTMPGKYRLLGPAPCEVERVEANFRHHLLIFAPDNRAIATWLDAMAIKYGEDGGIRVILDIDPASLQ